MPAAPLPANEADRQRTVDSLDLNTDAYEEIYNSVVRLIQAATHAPTCLFSILDKDRQFFKAHQGLDARETPRAQAFCGHVIVQPDLSQVLHVEDARLDPRFQDNPLVTADPNIRFYAGIPVRAANGLPVGTLCVIGDEPRAMTPELTELLGHGRKLLEDQLRLYVDSIRDPLSGLYNRRFMREALEREWRRSHRQLIPLALVMIDIDYFKRFNERYGHVKGDSVIAAVAQVLKNNCKRPSDMVARFGGEEFLAVLPQTDLAGVHEVAARLISGVAALGIPHKGSAHGVVTISVGAAIVHDRAGLTPGYNTVIDAADAAMYRAKAAGRNTYAVASDPGEGTAAS